MFNADPDPIPSHVPTDLIERDFPLVGSTITEENPFHNIIPGACEGPAVAFVPSMHPNGKHCWILRRHDDMAMAYADTEHFSNKGFSSLAQIIGETWELVPAEQDVPIHTLYRRMLNPIFSPGNMAKMDHVVRRACQEALASFAGKTESDFIHNFSFPFPVGVVLDLMDLPKSRMYDFQNWANLIIQNDGDIAKMQEGVRLSVDYLREVIANKKANPGEDLISLAVKAEVDGRKMNDEELLGYTFNFFIGGLDTVTAHTNNFVRYLAENPEEQRYLRDNPDKIPNAIEEMMRAFGAVTTYRTCIKDITIQGVEIKAGDIIAMVTALAGRDAETYEDPHKIQWDRNPRHVSFAVGPHHCLGVHLARRELRIALEELLKTLPPFRLKAGEIIKSQAGVIIQPRNMTLVWD